MSEITWSNLGPHKDSSNDLIMQHALILDMNSLLPLASTKKPIITGFSASGILDDTDSISVFCSDNFKSSIFKINKSKLSSLLS